MTKKATTRRSPQKHSSYDGTSSFDLNAFTQEEQNMKWKSRHVKSDQISPAIPYEIRVEARTKIEHDRQNTNLIEGSSVAKPQKVRAKKFLLMMTSRKKY